MERRFRNRTIRLQLVSIRPATRYFQPAAITSAVLLFLFLTASPISAQTLWSTSGSIATTLGYTDGPDSWLEEGLGRFNLGGSDGDGNIAGFARGQAGLRFETHSGWDGLLHFAADLNPQARQTRDFGLIEWFVRYRPDPDRGFGFRAGQFFADTSQENIQDLWTSPYLLTFSSINSWIGEEFRPIGIDLEYHWQHGESDWRATLTPFIGNDSLGALLAWRGWTIGSRLSTLGESLPLPQITSLAPGGSFDVQRDSGSRPFGQDLDGRIGGMFKLRWQRRDALFQISWVDNSGDRELHQGEYAWDTRFLIAGGEWAINEQWVIAAEATRGRTGMGTVVDSQVEMRFASAYLLTSYQKEAWRYSLRLDWFDNDDLDITPDDINDDHGLSLSLGAIWEPNLSWRLGFELTASDTERTRILDEGLISDESSVQALMELRYFFE